MNFGRHAQLEVARRGLLGTNPLHLADAQELLDCDLEFGAQLDHGFAMKADDRARAENAPNKNVVAFVDDRSGQSG